MAIDLSIALCWRHLLETGLETGSENIQAKMAHSHVVYDSTLQIIVMRVFSHSKQAIYSGGNYKSHAEGQLRVHATRLRRA